MRKIVLSLFAFLVITAACNQNPEAQSNTESSPVVDHSAAKEYVSLNCESCHSPSADHDSRLAPPFFAIRKHYLKDYPKQADFEKAIMDFIQHPQEENALMKGAVAEFGLMPPMLVEPDQAKALAAYLFEVEQAKPNHAGQGKHQEKEVQHLALSTKKVLGKNLMGALEKGGKEHALSFCNLKAFPLTDSMSTALAHSIRRVSDKARNPNNQATEAELEILAKYTQALQNKEEMSATIVETEAGKMGYFPILTNPMCLQCHGVLGEELEAPFYEKVKTLYPEDKAIGYGPGELRGMWVVALDSL